MITINENMDSLLAEHLLENGVVEVSIVAKMIGTTVEKIKELTDMVEESDEIARREGKELQEPLSHLLPFYRDNKTHIKAIAVVGIVGVLDNELGYPFHQEILDNYKGE